MGGLPIDEPLAPVSLRTRSKYYSNRDQFGEALSSQSDCKRQARGLKVSLTYFLKVDFRSSYFAPLSVEVLNALLVLPSFDFICPANAVAPKRRPAF